MSSYCIFHLISYVIPSDAMSGFLVMLKDTSYSIMCSFIGYLFAFLIKYSVAVAE